VDTKTIYNHQTNHHYKRFSKEFGTQKMKAKKSMRGQAVSNHRRRKDKE
jgi:hypothetical protein